MCARRTDAVSRANKFRTEKCFLCFGKVQPTSDSPALVQHRQSPVSQPPHDATQDACDLVCPPSHFSDSTPTGTTALATIRADDPLPAEDLDSDLLQTDTKTLDPIQLRLGPSLNLSPEAYLPRNSSFSIQNRLNCCVHIYRVSTVERGGEIDVERKPMLNKKVSMGSRHLDFKKSFQINIQSLLTAVSKEDLYREFSMCTDIEKENLYLLFIQVTKLLHENIAEQFESRCQETQVSSTFDKVELLVEEQTLDTLPADEACIKDAKEKVSTLKMDEIKYLKSLLQQVEEQNSSMESQIQSLKQNMGHSNAMTAVEKLRSWNPLLLRAPYG